jgi:pimeloyl-ACP methyl ester carboxylesterase
MHRLAALRFLIVSSAILWATLSTLAAALDGLARETSPPPTNIVIGFVGGFVNHDNPHHGPVKLARRIQQAFPQDTYVRVFENRHRKRAYSDIIRQLDTNHDGFLSPEEKARARVILFGQSWGGAAAVLLARDLRRQGVRVLLTVQVDSVAKSWQNDAVIPDNVDEAVNFYQPHGLIHGRARIIAADPSRTEILGNNLMDYRKAPVQCPEASWFDHVFTPSHMQTECDPRLWSQIETMVHQRLSPPNPSPETPAAVSAEVRPSAERR